MLLLLLIGIMAYLVMLSQEFAPIRNIVEVTRGSRFSSTVNDNIPIDSSKFQSEIFEENWPRFKQKLCPNDIPAHMKYGTYETFFLLMDHMLYLTISTFSQKLSLQQKIYSFIIYFITHLFCFDDLSRLKIGQKLFDLARHELGLKEMGTINQLRRDPDLAYFFRFMANAGTAFLTKFLDESNNATREGLGHEKNKDNIKNDTNNGTSSRGKNITNNPRFDSFLHIPIWKCGNNNIRVNLNHTMPLSSHVSIHKRQKDYWPDYIGGSQNIPKACVVTVVRDPITHFLSGYNEYETRLNDEVGTKLRRDKKWSGNPVNFERFEFGTEARFEQFVVDFLNGPRRDMLFDYWNNLYHMFSMTGVLTRFNQLYKRKLTGYLPSVTNLEENYPAFLKETCPGVLPENAYRPWKKEDRIVHVSEADESGFHAAANSVWESGGRTSRALCLIHAIDYACFDKIPVSYFCKKVYSSDNFVGLFKEPAKFI